MLIFAKSNEEGAAAEGERSALMQRLKRIAGLLALTYSICLIGWFLLYLVWRDGTWWLFLLNSFAVYLFLPVPFILIIAMWIRRRALWVTLALSTMVWTCLFGWSYMRPLFRPGPKADADHIIVMTCNVRADNNNTPGLISSIRRSGADIIVMQEIRPSIADALSTRLVELYPYQSLRPAPDVSGAAVISRYPVRELPNTIEGDWNFAPHVVEVQFNDQPVVLLNLHMRAPPAGNPRRPLSVARETNIAIKMQQGQAEGVLKFAKERSEPVIIAGDLNVTPASSIYRSLTDVFHDSWAKSGFGLGHTFPGDPRPSILGVRVPPWLVRLDYVLCSPHWEIMDARIGPWQKGTDHRPVIATLKLTNSE